MLGAKGASASAPAVEFSGVVHEYEGGHKAVRGVSLALKRGECLCLAGPNGAGKTTLIRMLLGFLPITSGDIRISGISVRDETEAARRRISYIPDEIALYRSLTGMQNLRFFAELLDRKESDDYFLKLADRVGLQRFALAKRLETYSKGMRQRLAIAVSLLKDVDVFVLDEPTTGLDPRGVRDLIGVLNDLRADGKSLIVATHDLLQVKSFATSVVFLAQGQIRQRIEDLGAGSYDLEKIFLELTVSSSNAAESDGKIATAAAP